MKKLILVAILFFCSNFSYAQNNPGESYALKISQRMKDQLQLKPDQQSRIYQIDIQLLEKKMALRKQYPGLPVLRDKIQQVENKRDNLYKGVLSTAQFTLYRQKKVSLLNNN